MTTFPVPAPLDAVSQQWGTLKVELPDFLTDIREGVNDVAQILITFLDIGVSVLQTCKSFLIGLLNPIQALIDAILAMLRGLVDDLRKIGVYFTSDNPQLVYPYSDLQGGFAEYERRMIGRLTDRTDPTRPDVSSNTKVLALFLYASVDLSEIERLIDIVKRLTDFFSQSQVTDGGLPVPVITGAKYGFVGSSLKTNLRAAFVEGTPPNQVEIAWRLAPTTTEVSTNPFLAHPPGGFLVTVSTFPEGLQLVYDRPQKNLGNAPSRVDPKKKVQPREYGEVRELASGQPVVLYGGADMLKLDASLAYNPSFASDGTIKPGYTRVYALRPGSEEAVIPLELLRTSTTHFFQKTFWIPFSDASAVDWMVGGFTHLLPYEEMPHAGALSVGSDGQVSLQDLGLASTYYVRVASCTEAEAEAKSFAYDLTAYAPQKDANQPVRVPIVGGARETVSDFSQPVQVVFPSTSTKDYLQAVETALAVLILSRADLPVLDELNLTPRQKDLARQGQLMIPGVALTQTGLEKMRHLVRVLYEEMDSESKRRGAPVTDFRTDLRNRIRKLTLDLYERTGPMPELEARIVQETQELRSITWGDLLTSSGETRMASQIEDMTIWESLDNDSQGSETKAEALEYGVGLNPYCVGVPETAVEELFFVDGLIRGREGTFIEAQIGGPGTSSLVQSATSAEASVLLNSGDYFLRDAYSKFLNANGSFEIPDENYASLQGMLALGRKEGSGDMCPVFFNGRSAMNGATVGNLVHERRVGMVFCRHLFESQVGRQVYQQAALALGVAASATKNFGPGQWSSFRFFDTFPSLEEFFQVVLNWAEGIDASIKGIVDQIVKHIEFLESRLTQLQQLIQRINALIQSILGFVFQIPACAALMLQSEGTDGVLGDLVTAENKPSDSPLAYGGGVALVMPLIPGAPVDFIVNLFQPSNDPVVGFLGSGSAEPLMGIEGLPAEPPPSDEPDVL